MKLSSQIGLLFALAITAHRTAAQPPIPVPHTLEESVRLPLPVYKRVAVPSLNIGARGFVTMGGGSKAGDFDQAPKAIKEVKPEYPVGVLTLAIAGEVRLDIMVDPLGDARDARVSFSPHPEFEAAAVDAALKWKFKPATKNGQPVATHFDFLVQFKIARTGPVRPAMAFAAPKILPKDYPVEFQYDKPPGVKLAAGAVYPFELAVKGQAGLATLTFLIDPLGYPRRIEIREATQPEFGAAASAMMAAWQFTPAAKGGKSTWTLLAREFIFNPREGDSILSESAARLVAELARKPSAILEGPGALDAQLKPRYQVAPAIPEAMLAGGIAADAEIEVIVDRGGRVQLPRVASATREDFGWAAATAVSRWLFVPPQQNGKPVDVRVRIPLGYEAPAKKAP